MISISKTIEQFPEPFSFNAFILLCSSFAKGSTEKPFCLS